jgi:hypothetical protein
MPLTFVAEPDKRLLAAAVRHLSRERFAILRAAGLLSGVAGLFCWLILDAGLGSLFLGLALGLFVGVGIVELGVRQATRLGVQRVARPTTYSFGPDGAGFSTELMRSELSWAAIRSTAELPGQVILGLVGGGFVTVPVGGLTDDQHAQLRALLSENAGRRATAVLPPVARTEAAAPKTPGVRPPAP